MAVNEQTTWVPLRARRMATAFLSVELIWDELPLSATDSVLLKYCSSTAHELSFSLLEIPHEP